MVDAIINGVIRRANSRPRLDPERSLILRLTLRHLTSAAADAQLKKIDDRSFAPVATESEQAIEAHRILQSEVNTQHERVITCDGLIDETRRLLTLDVEARHGKAGLKQLERLCGGRTRSEVTRLNVGEELTAIGEMIVRYEVGSTIPLDATLLATQRA